MPGHVDHWAFKNGVSSVDSTGQGEVARAGLVQVDTTAEICGAPTTTMSAELGQGDGRGECGILLKEALVFFPVVFLTKR